MITIAAACLILVGLMHSYLGGRNLISPLLAREDFPILLGSRRNGRLTLFFGWHALTLFWWAQAVVLLVIANQPSKVVVATLLTTATACAIMAVVAILVSGGRHLSWIFFVPIAVTLFTAAIT